MIQVEWHTDQTCENCGQFAPNCAELTFNILKENPISELDNLQILLCSNCIADLKQKLS